MKNIRCLICGMMINTKNYNLNKYSSINENKEDHITYCPFCGVSEDYIDHEKKEYSVDSKVLDDETLSVLDKAMKLEIFNGEFYEEASKLATSQHARQMFKDLSSIEFMHAKIHKKLGGFEKLPTLHKPDYTKYDTDEQLLEQAHMREEHAISFYNKKMDIICSDTIKEIFTALSDVEKEHMFITHV